MQQESRISTVRSEEFTLSIIQDDDEGSRRVELSFGSKRYKTKRMPQEQAAPIFTSFSKRLGEHEAGLTGFSDIVEEFRSLK